MKAPLYNSYPDGPGESLNLTLAGDATINCASAVQRWGLNGGSTVTGPHKLTIKWGGSGDYTEWNGVIFAPNSGDFELANGKLGIKHVGSKSLAIHASKRSPWMRERSWISGPPTSVIPRTIMSTDYIRS